VTFSERYGLQTAGDALQVDSMDLGLCNGLWSIFFLYFVHPYRGYRLDLVPQPNRAVFQRLWLHFFKARIDDINTYVDGFVETTKQWWLADTTMWWQRYEFIEYVLGVEDIPEERVAVIVAALNGILARDRAAYRIVNGLVVRLTSDEQIQAVEKALKDTSALTGVNHHLRRSLELMSDRQNPDFANSVKESISAIEALCGLIVGGKTTLGDALKRLESAGVVIHPALRQGFLNIYGYTSDADGIRHAAVVEPDISLDDATFFLVSNSAFVSYLLAKALSADIELVPATE
jgi:AbiJ N-terminal domain 4